MPGLKITLKRSLIGYEKSQGLTAKALGLGKLGSSVIQPDNAAIRGMIGKIEHVVVVEAVDADPPAHRYTRSAEPTPRVKRRRPNPTHAPRKA
jgi:large subunit ribosomal protein L30